MKTSIEEINGVRYTVVWQANPNAACTTHIATALPALPRNPKPEDAPLLYRYCSEGLELYGMVMLGDHARNIPYNGLVLMSYIVDGYEVTMQSHATDKDGSIIDIAIEGE